MKKYFLFAFVLSLLTIGTLAFAQTKLDPKIYDENGFRLDQKIPQNILDRASTSRATTTPRIPQPPQINKEAFKEGEPASCFDYYTFGSIRTNLQTNTDKYEAGSPVLIRGQITNDNRFPITNLTIRARLVRDIPNPEYLRSEIITVDDFNIVENITLNASSTFDINYSHLLPLNAPKGKYQLFFYVYNNDRFNQAGLSFTNDIVSARLSFDVTGNNPQQIYLDQTKITLNDQAHNVMAFMTQHEKDKSVKISIPLVNPSNQNEDMSVTYTLYKWDGLRKENIVDTKTETVSVPAKGKVQLSYITNKTDTSVYFLNITADNKIQKKDKSVYNIKTESNIRFVVNGYDFPRINSFGVDSYPIKANQEATLFTCYHNGASQDTLNPVNISTTIFDEKGNEIAKTEYQGKIGGDIKVIIKKFTTKKDLVNYRIVTELKDSEGKTMDKIENEYKCEDIDPTQCPKENYVWIWILLGVLILLGIIITILKSKNKIATVMFVFMVVTMSMFGGYKVEAATVTSSFDIPTTLANSWHVWGSFQKEFNFKRNAVNQSSNFDLNVGNSVSATNVPTTGSWFLAGDLNDSPPMDGTLYFHQGGDYTFNNVTGQITPDVNFSQGREAAGGASLGVPIESGSTAITSSNPNVVSCTNTGCTASSTGTAVITVSFVSVEQQSPYDYSCLTSTSVLGGNGGFTINELLWDFCKITNLDAPYITDPTGYFQNLGYSSGDYYDMFPNSPKKNLSGFYKSGSNGFGKVNMFHYSEFGEYDPEYAVYYSHAFSFPSITYTITVPPVANTPHTSSCSTATGNSSTTATVNWAYSDTDGDPQTQYQVQVDTSSDFSSPDFAISEASGNTSTSLTGLTASTTYYARVKTWSNLEEGSWSTCVNTFTTGGDPNGGTTPLNSPNFTTAIPYCTSAIINWTSVSGATSYDLYRGSTLKSSANILSYTDTGLNQNSSYTYSLVARNSATSSATSTESVTTYTTCGACGSATSTSHATAPSGSTLCSSGTASAVTGPISGLYSWACGTNSQTSILASCSAPSSGGVGAACWLDNVEVASGTSKVYYSARISKNCDPATAYCVGSDWRVGPLSTHALFSTSTYKFQKCVEPKASEF